MTNEVMNINQAYFVQHLYVNLSVTNDKILKALKLLKNIKIKTLDFNCDTCVPVLAQSIDFITILGFFVTSMQKMKKNIFDGSKLYNENGKYPRKVGWCVNNFERSDECIDFTMIITSRKNALISNFGVSFRWKSKYPWCIIEVLVDVVLFYVLNINIVSQPTPQDHNTFIYKLLDNSFISLMVKLKYKLFVMVLSRFRGVWIYFKCSCPRSKQTIGLMCSLGFKTRNSPSQKTSLRWGDCCPLF
ncbi:hypothetical protein AGLY_010214 [Aphis glycines]|uniref:Uncharacterized protein n=1 Tax=Aphis glycines TaxID=307491 RepID=A0A6G0TFI8_APHGL|nr:hypothetical protein AGLY_010214 [Aphis glycines]